MRLRRNTLACWLCAMTALALSALTMPGCGSAEKDNKSGDQPAVHPDDRKNAAAETPGETAGFDEKAFAADPFKVPDGSNAVLLLYINRVSHRQFKANSDAEFEAEMAKTANATLAAVEKILASKPTPDEKAAAVRAKLQALGVMVNAANTPEEQTAARDAVKNYATSLLDENPSIAKEARRQLLVLQFSDVTRGNAQEADKLAGALADFLKSPNLNSNDFRVASQIVRGLEMLERYELALPAYDAMARAFGEEKGDPRLAAESRDMADAAQRRLGVIGKPLEIEGTLSDGTAVDWAEYRGKVVLVDFWATWCGPCVGEIPNVKKNYEQFHDKGFEVLGVSLDDEAAHVTGFLAENHIPWKTLFSSDKEHQGWNHPLAKKFGITSIPATVLVNKEGKVITLAARGEKLGQELEKLLGSDKTPQPPDATNATLEKPQTAADKGAEKPEEKPAARPTESDKPSTPTTAATEKADAAASKAETADDEPKLTGNPYLPSKKLTAAGLVEFITLAREKPVSVKQRAGFYEGLIVAADRVLAADLDQMAKTLAILAKLEALHAMSLSEEKGVDEQIQKLVEQAKDEKDPELAKEVRFQSLEQRTMNSDDLKQDQLVPLLDEIAKYFGDDPPITRQSRLASGVVHVINRIQDDKVAKKQMVRFAPIFRKSKDQYLVRYGRKLAEAAGIEKEEE